LRFRAESLLSHFSKSPQKKTETSVRVPSLAYFNLRSA
jgi:hypothetical protein